MDSPTLETAKLQLILVLVDSGLSKGSGLDESLEFSSNLRNSVIQWFCEIFTEKSSHP